MPSLPARALMGFIAGALSVLSFHQGVVELFHLAGVTTTAWSMRPVPPFSVPFLVDLCFWGGVYGLIFGIAAPALRPVWAYGIALGCIATAVAWFVVAPLKGMPMAYGGDPQQLIRSLLTNAAWGLGVGLILLRLLPEISPRPQRRRRFAG